MKFFKICAEVLVPKFTRAEVRLPVTGANFRPPTLGSFHCWTQISLLKKKMFQNALCVMTEIKLEIDIKTFCYQHSSMLQHSSSNSEEIMCVNFIFWYIQMSIKMRWFHHRLNSKNSSFFFILKHSSCHRNYCTNNQWPASPV